MGGDHGLTQSWLEVQKPVVQCQELGCDTLPSVPLWHRDLGMWLWYLHWGPGCWERAAVMVLGH